MASHSSILAWRIPGMGEPGGLRSMGLHRVRHDWSNLAEAAAAACSMWHLSSPTRDQFEPFALEAQSLNHWTAKEVLREFVSWQTVKWFPHLSLSLFSGKHFSLPLFWKVVLGGRWGKKSSGLSPWSPGLLWGHSRTLLLLLLLLLLSCFSHVWLCATP